MAVISPVSMPETPATMVDAGPISKRDTGPSANAVKTAEAFRQFEAFVLQSFIETMLPKNSEAVFGKGTAGAIWKSMLAEKLADQISRNGGVGIARQIGAVPPAGSEQQAAWPIQAGATQMTNRKHGGGDV